MTGPVQVLVIGFDRPAFSGEVMAELERLREAGTARLLDVLLVERAGDGSFETLPPPAGAAPGMGELAAGILGVADPDGSGDRGSDGDGSPVGPSWSLADVVPVGASAAVALIEHLWAAPLREAVEQAGGTALDEIWLTRDDVVHLDTLRSQTPSPAAPLDPRN